MPGNCHLHSEGFTIFHQLEILSNLYLEKLNPFLDPNQLEEPEPGTITLTPVPHGNPNPSPTMRAPGNCKCKRLFLT